LRLSTALSLLRTSFGFQLARAPSKRNALSMGIVLLMTESRVPDMKVLDDLLKGQNFRVQSFKETYFLEHAPSLDRYPSSPVRRYKISEMTAALLATARSGHYQLNIAANPLSPQLLRLGEALGMNPCDTASTLEFVKGFATTVNQANAQQFPGFLAAYLNGQIVTVGLGHLDWIRVQTGNAVQLPDVAAPIPNKEVNDKSENEFETTESADTDDASYVFMARELTGTSEIEQPNLALGQQTPASDLHPAGITEPNEQMAGLGLVTQQAQQRSHVFFRALRDELNTFEKQKSSPRRNLDIALSRVIRDSPQVSRTCRLLGEWIRSLIWRKNHGALIAISSLSRYLNALSVCFEAVASEHDLLACDGDDVTAFYQDVMEARWAIRPHTYSLDSKSNAATANGAQNQEAATAGATDDKQDTYRTRRLALQLLRDFHRLMSRTVAVEDPDWSEIDTGDDVLSISPGVMLEKEYQYALSLAARNPESASREDLSRAFILIAAMRFGLRGAEITGLMRTDWVDTVAGAVVVLVQKNKYRNLKTPAARRQVPLLFALTDIEQRIIARFLALWDGISRGDASIPLFTSSLGNGALMNEKLLRWQASHFIKRATLNQDLSLHHARHTFANRVGLILLENTENIWPHSALETVSQEQRSHVRKLLLGTEEVTRRSLWALARLLGHAHPQTSARSYLHFLPDLADQYVWEHQTELKKNWPTPFDVSLRRHDLRTVEAYLSPADTVTAPARLPAPSPQASLRFLYLFQHGATLERASFSTGIESTDAETLVDVIRNVDQTLARRTHINEHKGGASTLLGHIRLERWTQLIALAGSAVAPKSRPLTSWALLESALKMIGPSRQILLYREHHFKLFRQIVNIWSLPNSSFKIVSQHAPHPRLQEWAADVDLDIEALAPTKKGSTLQLDVVEDGDPATPQKHRCAVLPALSDGSLLHDSFEMVMLVSVTLFLLSSSAGVNKSGAEFASLAASMETN